ncbi:aldehyde dehydrogenase family protein [Oerskovia sp. M15]
MLGRRSPHRAGRRGRRGRPADCIQWVEQPSLEATSALMNNDGVSLILATGGNAMVRAAYSAGKPALGVGAGNVPAYIEKSAKLGRAVNDVVLSKGFDNGMVCASEQAVILDTEIYDEALAEFAHLHAYLASPEEKARLERFIFGVEAGGANCAGARLNASIVGKSPGGSPSRRASPSRTTRRSSSRSAPRSAPPSP